MTLLLIALLTLMGAWLLRKPLLALASLFMLTGFFALFVVVAGFTFLISPLVPCVRRVPLPSLKPA